MKPFDLSCLLQQIVASETGCAVSWSGPDKKQSRGPVTREELRRIRIRAVKLIDEAMEP